MATNPKLQYMTVEEYLKLDNNSPDAKYEYIDGYVRLMTGGSLSHAALAFSIGGILRTQGRDRGCRAYSADARVQITTERYVYPDATVSCDEQDRGRSDLVRSPRLVVEILSPGTERYDRAQKAKMYHECPTIEEYLLIESRYQYVELLRRAGAFWYQLTYSPGDEVELTSLGIRFAVDDLYAETDVPQELEAEPAAE